MAGITDKIGVEWDEHAAKTATAAGHRTIVGDVLEQNPYDVLARTGGIGGEYLLIQASPPCQGLSTAGKGVGREDLDKLFEAVVKCDRTPASVKFWSDWLQDNCSDERSPLTFEIIRWVAELGPEFVMLEQVPAALPIWEAIADKLETWGYSTWAGFVHSEQFGVPQTRKRAMMLASSESKVEAPVPTHSKFHNRSPERLDAGVLPWVSMAEALGFGQADLIGFPRKHDGQGEAVVMDGEEYRGRDLREGDKPAFAVTSKARSWERFPEDTMLCPTNLRPNASVRPIHQPAPTMAFGHETPRWVTPEELAAYRAAVKAEVEPRVNNQSGTEFDLAWPADRPAPTVAGREIVTMPGANANRFNGATKSRNDGIRVHPWEAGVLQSFPADYPWQGTRTRQYVQIGNAVPPLLQAALAFCLISASVSDEIKEAA